MGNRLENDRDYRVSKGEREWKVLGMKQGENHDLGCCEQ